MHCFSYHRNFISNDELLCFVFCVQLLDSFTIACVMVLSFFFLRVRYKLINLMGVSLALIGIVCLVLATQVGSGSQTGVCVCCILVCMPLYRHNSVQLG